MFISLSNCETENDPWMTESSRLEINWPWSKLIILSDFLTYKKIKQFPWQNDNNNMGMPVADILFTLSFAHDQGFPVCYICYCGNMLW